MNPINKTYIVFILVIIAIALGLGLGIGLNKSDSRKEITYVGSKDNHLYAINEDGTEEWKFLTGGEVTSSPTIGSDGTIYVGSNDNYLS